MTSQYDVLVSLMLAGDTEVGKTSLLRRYTSDEYLDTHVTTLGVDFKTLITNVDGICVKVQLWDTAGQERYGAILKNFYRKAQGIFIIYDVLRHSSLYSVDKWISTINETSVNDPTLILIGNKIDENVSRQVSYWEAQEVADKFGMLHYEVSARNCDNLDEPLQAMIRCVMNKNMTKATTPDSFSDIAAGDSIKLTNETVVNDKTKKKFNKSDCCIII